MPTFQFEAMDATGQEIRDVIDAATEEEAQTTIRQMGYFVTKISVKKSRKSAAEKGKDTKKGGRTPEQAGLRLRARPRAPRRHSWVLVAIGTEPDPEWEQYLN